ncbi:MAG: DMT family transporter [Planctomycetota bacterium]|jgi:drug/metabolite transporter (DMT)-like permease
MSSSTTKVNTTATFACVGALICWTIGPNIIKYLTGYLDFWTQNMLRYLAACLFWLPFLLFSIKKKNINADVWKKASLPAAANIIMQSLWAACFYYIKPAFMNLLTKSSVIWIAGFSIIFFSQERPLIKSKRFWFGIVLSSAGVCGVLIFKEDFKTATTLTGIVIALLAALMWGVYTITAKIAFKDTDSRNGFAVTSIYTVIGLSVLAFLFGTPDDCLKLNVKLWSFVVFSGVISIGFSHVLYYTSIRRLGATIPSLVLLLSPFTVLAVSRIAFDESLNAFQWFFGIILLFGAGFAIWAQQHLRE